MHRLNADIFCGACSQTPPPPPPFSHPRRMLPSAIRHVWTLTSNILAKSFPGLKGGNWMATPLNEQEECRLRLRLHGTGPKPFRTGPDGLLFARDHCFLAFFFDCLHPDRKTRIRIADNFLVQI